jgi:uncharacterized protein YndB with AHSA1/START domain
MIETSQHLSAVARSIGSRTLAAGEARVLTISRVYDTDVEDLWDACTTAERISRWLMPVTGELKLGGHYQLEGNANGTVESCDRPNSFAATWEYGGEVSWIEVTFTPADSGARLQVQHIAHVDDERWVEYGPGAVGVGWDQMLLGLGLYLQKGHGVDPADAVAWLASPDGVAFVTTSSDAWCDASVAAGAPPDEARAAADRTTAAYTGAG